MSDLTKLKQAEQPFKTANSVFLSIMVISLYRGIKGEQIVISAAIVAPVNLKEDLCVSPDLLFTQCRRIPRG